MRVVHGDGRRTGDWSRERSYDWSYERSQPADRGDHARRATTTLVGRAEARDCGGEPGAWYIADHGGTPLRHQQWLALHMAAASAGRIAGDRVPAGGEVRTC